MKAAAEIAVKRSDTVWYDDGSVVLQAEDTLFRVYRGILQSNASVFKDLFELPQPDDAERYEGCPLITMHDTSEDMEVFLRTLHECS